MPNWRDRTRRPKDVPGKEEILAMEVSEDKRLREVGIDPDGDPIQIMVEVRKRALADKAEDARRDAKKD
jgi:hypothetical protein